MDDVPTVAVEVKELDTVGEDVATMIADEAEL